MVEEGHHRREADRRFPWERPASLLALVLTVLTVVAAIVKGANYFATKIEVQEAKLEIKEVRASLKDNRTICQDYIDRSQEAQDSFFKEYIANAAKSAADQAVEKWIAWERRKQ